MDSYILQLKDLESFNSFKDDSIEEINLDIMYNEVHALVYDSDSLIKTFMEIITGRNKNAKGKIIYKNKEFDICEIHKINKMSFLFKESVLIENFTVAENISFKKFPQIRFLHFINWKKVNDYAKQLLKELDFDINYKLKISDLSNEEKKLVNIAMCFSEKPEIIFMYNPSEGLKSTSIKKLYQVIDKFKNSGKSIVYITNLWEEALKVSDRISILSDGRIKKTLTSDEARRDPQELLNILHKYNPIHNKSKISNKDKEVLDAVFKASQFITSEYELSDVLLLLAKQVTKFMNADECIIYLIDEVTSSIIDELEFKNKSDMKSKLKAEIVLEIAHNQKLYYANNHEKDFNLIFESYNNTNTIICVPILVRSHVTGIIQICYESFYTQTEEETRYLLAFEQYAALAIENTRLMGRSTLLQESNHRIKNNLQSIINIILMEKQGQTGNCKKQLNDVLDVITSRIESIATVNDLLSRDKFGRSIINIKDLMKKVVNHYTNMDTNLQIELEVEDIFVPYNKANSIALIINELVSNCLKHAFEDKDDDNIIRIYCKKNSVNVLLSIEDNGVGLSNDFDINKLKSSGLFIVSSIIQYEFKGQIQLTRLVRGTKVDVSLPSKNIFVNYSEDN